MGEVVERTLTSLPCHFWRRSDELYYSSLFWLCRYGETKPDLPPLYRVWLADPSEDPISLSDIFESYKGIIDKELARRTRVGQRFENALRHLRCQRKSQSVKTSKSSSRPSVPVPPHASADRCEKSEDGPRQEEGCREREGKTTSASWLQPALHFADARPIGAALAHAVASF